jgi:chromodomain-helicase-DNA-binding protein 4
MIDRTLKKRGQLHLIYNQPLRLIEKDKGSSSNSRKGVKPKTQRTLPTQLPSNPKVPSGPQPLRLMEKDIVSASGSRKGVKLSTQKALPTQLPLNPNPQDFHTVEMLYGNEPSASTSARGRSTETIPPPKRPSDASSSAKKRQKMGSYPGCPICEGPHHLVKDCPVVAEGSKR